jgi:hypothetical protein
VYNQINSIPTPWLFWKTAKGYAVGVEFNNEKFTLLNFIVGVPVGRSVSDNGNESFSIESFAAYGSAVQRPVADSANAAGAITGFTVTGGFERAVADRGNESFALRDFLRLQQITEMQADNGKSGFLITSFNV